jgi:pantetheine-phosphate adenylyltransferase
MKTAVYAGSFDPPHRGHAAVAAQAAQIFDELFLGVAINPLKAYHFGDRKRIELVEAMAQDLRKDGTNRTVTVAEIRRREPLVEWCRTRGVRFIVRGIRGPADLEAEVAMRQVNKDLAPEITTVFFLSPATLQHVSSTAIRQLMDLGPHCRDTAELYLTSSVVKAMNEEL